MPATIAPVVSVLTPKDWELAIHAQSACNLSGVVFGFAEIMKKICTDSETLKRGTDWRNQHPISRLYAEQIAHLSSGSDISHTESWFTAIAHAEYWSKQPTVLADYTIR